MSTEVLQSTFALLKDDLVEGIQDENLDILDEFSAEYLAEQVILIAHSLAIRPVVTHKLRRYDKKWVQYTLKVNNKHGGFVSVSDDSGTGVSRTLYYPYKPDDEESPYSALMNLAQMINEAWYQCKNDLVI